MNPKTKMIIAATAVIAIGGALAYHLFSRVPFEDQIPAVGEPAPSVAAADLSGRMLRLADYRGKVVLINFWASWCPPCKDEMPGFQRVFMELEDKGFAVIGMAMNEVTPADIRELNILFPVVLANDRVKRDYGDIAHPPVSFLVGREGKIIRKVRGVYAEEKLRKDVQQALKAGDQ